MKSNPLLPVILFASLLAGPAYASAQTVISSNGDFEGTYAGSSDSGNNSGVSFFIDVSGANSISQDLTLEFDVLNDTGVARNFGYTLQIYNADADGQLVTGGTASDSTSNRTPYSFASNAPVTVSQGSFSVGANTSNFTSSGAISIPYGTPADWLDPGFPGTFTFGNGGTNSTDISAYSDITRLYSNR